MRDRHRKLALVKGSISDRHSVSECWYSGEHHRQSLTLHGGIYPIVDLDTVMSDVILRSKE